MRIVINHLNKALQEAMSDVEKQSVDEHMTKFKGRMSCKQYMKNKATKCFSSGGIDAAAKDICVSLVFILAKRKKQRLGLGKQLFWIWLRN